MSLCIWRSVFRPVSFAVGLVFLFNACSKESTGTTATAPSVTISSTAQTISEDAGTASVTVSLSQAATEAVTINLVLSGTAVLNGDYETSASESITIPAGETSAALTFTIFDDAILEPQGKTIDIAFSSTSNITFDATSASITITDNDTSRASEGFQADLAWDSGALVNLDLYITNNVQVSDNQITDFDVVSASENEKGFESVFLNNSDTDGEYYLAVSYTSGSRAVSYSLGFTGPSISDSQAESFTADQEGYAVFWGPITKSGSSYSRATGGRFSITGLTPHVFKGEIRQ